MRRARVRPSDAQALGLVGGSTEDVREGQPLVVIVAFEISEQENRAVVAKSNDVMKGRRLTCVEKWRAKATIGNDDGRGARGQHLLQFGEKLGMNIGNERPRNGTEAVSAQKSP